MNEIEKHEPNQVVKFHNGHTSELCHYSDKEVVLNSNRIETYRINQGLDRCIQIFSGYLLQANLLIGKDQRIPAMQVAAICKKLLDGPAWNLSFEELSNIISTGIVGGYGKIYRLDLPTIGGWINQYNEVQRKEIFERKYDYRDQRRNEELSTMEDNHIKLFKEILKK